MPDGTHHGKQLGPTHVADALVIMGTLDNGAHPADGDASLWVSTKLGKLWSTLVSSSGWASRVINNAAIVVRGLPSDPAQMKQRFPNKIRAISVRTSRESAERATEAVEGVWWPETQPRIVQATHRTSLPKRVSFEFNLATLSGNWPTIML